ncbi:PcfK-like family protein [Draconibacterium orientale]|uniref:PcfK-like family protein n=1 Tax=Draconibacterium orientale TaxID=1168034 RepID=UPI0029C08DBD|nr:PcfK-like family protein [Draconibacterium orientale]
MKASNHFKNTIKAYLDQRAENDVLFSLQYSKPEKNIDDCVTYILNTVQKSGCNGFADEEIYSMAVHYYDEDNINIGNPIDCHVAVNHVVELTEEEKQQARKEALQRVHNEAYAKLTQTTKRAKQPETANQQSLFNF